MTRLVKRTKSSGYAGGRPGEVVVDFVTVVLHAILLANCLS